MVLTNLTHVSRNRKMGSGGRKSSRGGTGGGRTGILRRRRRESTLRGGEQILGERM